MSSNVQATEESALLRDPGLRVGFIGAGNMAQAVIGSLLKGGVLQPSQLLVSAPSDTRLAPLRLKGIQTTHDNDELLQNCSVVFLCVKPYVFASMLAGVTTDASKCVVKLFISVMASVPISVLEESLKPLGSAGVIRSLPNTPCMVGEGCCVYAKQPTLSPELSALGHGLLECQGLVRVLPEHLINAASAVSGSGVAYLYAAMEAIADGGVKMGLPRELAMALSAQMVRGAATMVQQTGRHPGQLKDEVCSPGGPTIAAMSVLETHAFRGTLISAVEAAFTRGDEMRRLQEEGKKN